MQVSRPTAARAMGCLSLVAASACTPAQPARWAEGGAPLQLAPAEWTEPGLSTLELRANGQVFQDGQLQFSVDARGRVTDANADPYALLASDGQLFTSDDAYAGRVGLRNAAPPWGPVAWLRIDGSGEVVWFDDDGEAHHAGRWSGCDGATLRTCTLVTHLVLLSAARESQAAFLQPYPFGPYWPYPSFGVGIGVGVGGPGAYPSPRFVPRP